MKQGTISVLVGCHSIVHSVLVIIAWVIVYKKLPKGWEVVCIFLHDIGHWGTDYLNNIQEKKTHWKLGAKVAKKLYGDKGYEFTAWHCSSSYSAASKLRLADKHSWIIAPTLWLWSNNVFEPKLIRSGKSRWESGKFWKMEMSNFIKNADYNNLSAHDIYLRSMEKKKN